MLNERRSSRAVKAASVTASAVLLAIIAISVHFYFGYSANRNWSSPAAILFGAYNQDAPKLMPGSNAER